ncbi:MAG: NUDIX domain-containing protein [Acidobacteria bacterium]|nr:NUDIX domain-containing protein [Acidobacteriota bacterium]
MIHTESAGGVVLNPEGLVLLVSQHGTSWSLPKGHLEDGESPLEAARREIREETGVERLELVRPLGSYTRYRLGADGGEDRSELKTIHLFLFSTDETELAPQDADNPEARWVERGSVTGFLTHAKDKEFFASILGTI